MAIRYVCDPDYGDCARWRVATADSSALFADAGEAVAAYEAVARRESAELVDPSGRVVARTVRLER